MITVGSYREGDEDLIQERSEDDWGTNESAIRLMISQCPAWTFRINDEVIMLMGVWELWKGNWECWSMPSDKARGHAFEIVKLTRGILHQLEQRSDVKRFTALSREDKGEYNRWLKLLGFDVEYRQKQAYDGKLDVIGYRRLAA